MGKWGGKLKTIKRKNRDFMIWELKGIKNYKLKIKGVRNLFSLLNFYKMSFLVPYNSQIIKSRFWPLPSPILLKRFHKSHKCFRLELIFHKKVHQGVFLLNCTMNRDICKWTFLIGAFIQHLIYFWLGFLGLFLGGGVENCSPIITLDSDSHKKWQICRPSWVLSKVAKKGLQTSAVFITL